MSKDSQPMIANQPVLIQPEQYEAWLKLASTERLLVLEAGWLRYWVKQLHGCNLLYAGIDPHPKFLKSSRARHVFRSGLPWSFGHSPAQMLMDDEAWPFADASLDVVVLQHAIDFSAQPHQLLREATRTLIPGGYIVMIGFNPLSLWGGWRWLRTFSSKLPWLTQPVSPNRLQDWLTLLDMKIEQRSACGHLWPLSLGFERMNRRVDRVLMGSVLPACLNLIVARKTVAGMTPIRFRMRPLIDNGFALPVATATQANTGLIRNK